MDKKWKIKVPRGRTPKNVQKRKLSDGVKTALVATAIAATYFGIIAVLMMPAFDVA